MTVVLYSGIGNRLRISINELKKDMPIEPVGVIVLAIDGVRQDVLYAPQNGTGDGTGIVSSYTDTTSCGGSCYVEPKELKGLCDVLGGKYEGTEITDPLDPNAKIPGPGACTTDSWENRHIKIPDVTAIFPSITFASWASIFTGKMPGPATVLDEAGTVVEPGGTGIVGNEFFARDLYNANTSTNQAIPGMGKLPSGFVSLDAGAFDPGGADFALNHVIPVEFELFGKFSGSDTLKKKLAESASNRALSIPPVWDSINTLVQSKYKTSEDADIRCDKSEYECRTVSILNQYTSGSVNGGNPDLWATPDSTAQSLLQGITSWFNAAKIMDKAAAAEAVDFIKGYYSKTSSDGKRKRFPALLSIYFSGLDHDAHEEDLGGYKEFFKKLTDARIARITQELKDKDEFDNKIFIVVADHGHTEMPTNLKYTKTNVLGVDDAENTIMEDEISDAEMSCKLKLDFQIDALSPEEGKNKRKAEQANNNLHIWELGDYFKTMGEVVEQTSGIMLNNRVLAPKEIAELFKNKKTKMPLPNGAAAKKEDATIIAALNGPMAHIYVKGADWGTAPDINTVTNLAELFRVTLQGAKGGVSPLEVFTAAIIDALPDKIGGLSNSVDEILVRDGSKYKVYTVDNTSNVPQVVLRDIEGYFSDKYVEAKIRMEGMNHEKRSGDIVLLMKDELDIPASEIQNQRYTTGVACKSWHGSLNRSDSYVPFIVSYPGGNNNEIEKVLQRETTCKPDYSLCKGNWKLTDVVEEIIMEQFK